MVVVLLTQPVREALQNALDRLFYRDRYDYRRALVGFARDLNTDLDVVRLSQRLVSRIVETLVVDRMALMLADERSHDFSSIGDFGFSHPAPKLPRNSSFLARLDAGHTVALDDPIAAARFAAEEVEFWRDAGIYYFVPCVFEGRAIAVLALGRKDADQPFNSEDLALLTAVAGQAATAIENGRLYRQLHLKAEELDGCASSTRTSSSRSTTAWSCSTRRRSGSSAGTARSRASTAWRGRTRSAGRSATCSRRRSSRRCAPIGARTRTARRCSACRWWAATRKGRGCWSTRRRCRCRVARITRRRPARFC